VLGSGTRAHGARTKRNLEFQFGFTSFSRARLARLFCSILAFYAFCCRPQEFHLYNTRSSFINTMAGPTEKSGGSQSQTPGKNQRSILGFLAKRPVGALQPLVNGVSNSVNKTLKNANPTKPMFVPTLPNRVDQTLTPAPSSDAIAEDESMLVAMLEEEEDDDDEDPVQPRQTKGPPSSFTPASRLVTASSIKSVNSTMSSSPPRKVCLPPNKYPRLG